MPRTRFDPSLDGFPSAFNADIGPQEAQQIREIFNQASQDALVELRRAYYDGVQVFNLEHFLTQWVRSAELQAGGYQAGMLFAMLDHFHAALPLPEISTLVSQEFRNYLQARNLENLHQNATVFLTALCIYTLIPEDWLPSQVVSERIRRAVTAVKMVDEVQIELDLGLAPGGKRWLDEQTRRSLDEILIQVDSGLPCPVWIIRSLDSLVQHNQVIVYGYDQPEEGTIFLWVYDLDCPGEAHQIRIEQKQGRLVMVESCEERKPMTIQGLLVENYTPAPPPDVSIPWWGEIEFVRRIVWSGRHFLRGLQRRIRPASEEGLLGSIPPDHEK